MQLVHIFQLLFSIKHDIFVVADSHSKRHTQIAVPFATREREILKKSIYDFVYTEVNYLILD